MLILGPRETPELFAAPNFAGGHILVPLVAWICRPEHGASRSCSPSPRQPTERCPRHAGLLSPLVRFILAAALVLSLGERP